MNVNLLRWSKRWLFAIVGLFVLAYAGVQAQDVKIFTIKDFNEGGHADPVCKTARFFSVSAEGKLVWVEEGPFMNSMWYKIPVAGSETDFYLKNVATGQYVFRGYKTEGAVAGDQGFTTNQETKGWNWDYAYLSNEIAAGKEEYFQFRALPARWGWATDLVNVAGAIWENHGDEGKPAFGFVINGQHKFTKDINGSITNTGGALAYPAAGIMRCTDNGQQGNAWTVVHFDEVAAGTEFIKSKITVESRSATNPFLVETATGNLEWGPMVKANKDLSAWYVILDDPTDPDGDFYLKNASTGKYVFRKGDLDPTRPSGDWDNENGLLDEDKGKADLFRFFIPRNDDGNEKWPGYGFLVNMRGALGDDPNFPKKGTALCLQTGPGNANDWVPVAKIGSINDGGNHWTTVKLGVPVNVMFYTVTFKGNNGQNDIVQSVEEDKKATKPADPTRINYTFGGWFLDEACAKDEECTDDEFDFNTPITKDITLFAKWIYEPEPIKERQERKVRILNWGNNTGKVAGVEKFITYAYLGENEDGLLEWIEATPENVNDYTAWMEIPVEGSNYLNYYKNAATGKYIYMDVRMEYKQVDPACKPTEAAPCELKDFLEPVNILPVDGAWKWEAVLLSEEIDNDKKEFYQFWPIPKSDWGQRVHLANMGGVKSENPYNEKGAAFYLGPINSNHGDWGNKNDLAYPRVTMSSLDGNNGNVWASVLIEPVFKQVRIQDWNDADKPSKYLRVNETGTGDNREYALEWSDNFDDYTIWEEMSVAGSATEFFYRNYGTTSRNHGTGRWLYRETKEFAGDWGQAQALLNGKYEATDYYHFRKETTPDWGGHCWMVNMADAEFDANGKFVAKKAFVLSGINKQLDWMDYEYPEVLMHIMPGKDNCWSAVKFSDVAQKRNYTLTYNMSGGGQNINIQVPEGDLIVCLAEEPERSGYTFEGWFTNQACTEAYDCEEPIKITANFTLYAKWKIIPASTKCTPEIEIIRIGDFQGDTNGKHFPREFLKCSEKGSLSWFEGSGAGYGKDFEENDKTIQWYKIPVPGSNFDFYFKNVQYGFYLQLDTIRGTVYGDSITISVDGEDKKVVHPKRGQQMKPSDQINGQGYSWQWKGTKTSAYNYKTPDFKWQILRGSWQDQGWGAGYLGCRWGAVISADGSSIDGNVSAGFFTISNHLRLHDWDLREKDPWPSRTEVQANTLGDTYLKNGNAWTSLSLYIGEEKVANPDCCGDVECCDGKPCVKPCVDHICVCSPNGADCQEFCVLNPNDPHCKSKVGVPELGYLQNLKVFPNPTKNQLFISGLAGGELITVYTINGQRVLNTIATGEQTAISVSQLLTGTYIVKVSTGRGEWSTKFVVD